MFIRRMLKPPGYYSYSGCNDRATRGPMASARPKVAKSNVVTATNDDDDDGGGDDDDDDDEDGD